MEETAGMKEALEGAAAALVAQNFPQLNVAKLEVAFDARGNNFRTHRNADGSVELKIFLNPARNSFASLVERAADAASKLRERKVSVPSDLFKKMYQASADQLSEEERVICMGVMLGGK
jgi:hypothetical protein